MAEAAEQNINDVTEDTFKRWVKEYRLLDEELKNAGKTIGAMRKRKKQLDESIKGWMQVNKYSRVHLRENEFLERHIKTSQKAVNADLISSTLEEYFSGDATQAAEVTGLIYNGREETEAEILKIVSDQPKKRAKTRPVDVEDEIDA